MIYEVCCCALALAFSAKAQQHTLFHSLTTSFRDIRSSGF